MPTFFLSDAGHHTAAQHFTYGLLNNLVYK